MCASRPLRTRGCEPSGYTCAGVAHCRLSFPSHGVSLRSFEASDSSYFLARCELGFESAISHNAPPTGTSAVSFAMSFKSVPAAGDSNSKLTFSVSSSTKGSPRRTLSPSRFNQRTTIAFVLVTPLLFGTITVIKEFPFCSRSSDPDPLLWRAKMPLRLTLAHGGPSRQPTDPSTPLRTSRGRYNRFNGLAVLHAPNRVPGSSFDQSSLRRFLGSHRKIRRTLAISLLPVSVCSKRSAPCHSTRRLAEGQQMPSPPHPSGHQEFR